MPLLFPKLKQFLHFRNDFAVSTPYINAELSIDLLFRLQRLANLRNLPVRNPKLRKNCASPRPAKPDGRGLIPNNVIPPKNLNKHHHVKRIGHRIKRAAVMRAHIIRVPPPQLHFHVNFFPVRLNPLDANARTHQRRPKIEHQFQVLFEESLEQENLVAESTKFHPATASSGMRKATGPGIELIPDGLHAHAAVGPEVAMNDC
jgi:hypothetical protein